ncbi:MAG: hypothetical protein ABI717_00050 [Actinomycetota bacterium]
MIAARQALAITAVATVLLYAGGGHSAGTMPADHEDMAGADAGICLVLVAFLIVAAFPQRPLNQTPRHAFALAPPSAVSERSRPPDGRSRASPVRLQRFRN